MWLLLSGAVCGQDDDAEPLVLGNLAQSGLRSWLTDSWATLEFTIANRSSEDRTAQVVAFFPDRPDVQYARDVWVPGKSVRSTWLLIGPAPRQTNQLESRDVEILLYDRTGGQNRLVLPPGELRVRSRGFLYKPRQSIISVLLDRSEQTLMAAPQWNAASEQALRLLYTFRQAAPQLPLHLNIIGDRFLPPLSEGFDGVQLIVIAGRRIVEDPPGALALRRWLQEGGTVWVMLDLTDPAIVARLLGDSLPIQVVGRTSLTSPYIQSIQPDSKEVDAPLQLEQPVDLVRVLLAPEDELLDVVDGWPAAFTRRVGRGNVLFTTIGARAWFRERTRTDPPSPASSVPDLPVVLRPLEKLARQFGPSHESDLFYAKALEPLVTGEIGYTVPDWSLPALVFGGFLLAILVLGPMLRHANRLTWAGSSGPAAALIATAVFFTIGRTLRNSVPPTVASAEVVHVAPASNEQAAQGMVALYRSDAGPIAIAAAEGGTLELDAAGLQGQTLRRVVTDTRAWHWEDTAVPAGLRLGRQEYTIQTGEPLAAIARFGRAGLTGRVAAGSFRGLADALISTPTRRVVAVRLEQDGAFTAGNDAVLPAGQYLSDVFLSDRQQRRVAVYRQLLAGTDAPELAGRNVLLVWAETPQTHFTLVPGARMVASTLLAIPLEFDLPPANSPVTVASAFIPYQRLIDGKASQPTLESGAAVDMHLRFQMPRSVLPFKVDRARLFGRVRALKRHFTVTGYTGDKPDELFAADSPAGAISVEITKEALLRLDEQGQLRLNVAVGELPAGEKSEEMGQTASRWSIESLELEVAGRILPENESKTVQGPSRE